MKKNIEKLKKMVSAGNPQRITKLAETIKNQVGKSPQSKKNTQIMEKTRGKVLDMSIRMETIFNEILLLFNRPRIIETSFKMKVQFLKRIIKEVDKEAKHFRDDRRFRKLNDLVLIRNLFAHVPVNLSSNILQFEIDDPYLVYFNDRLELKNVNNAAVEFADLYNYVQGEISLFIHLLREFMDKRN